MTLLILPFQIFHVIELIYLQISTDKPSTVSEIFKVMDNHENDFNNIDLSCLTSQTFSIVSITVSVIVSIATIFGNSLILLSIYKYPVIFKNSLYKFIGNLAVADILLGLWLLLFIYEEVFPEVQSNWYFCITKPVGALVSYACSCLSLLGISVDRFLAIVFPLKHIVLTQRSIYIRCVICMIWIISIVPGILSVIILRLGQRRQIFLCRIGSILPREYELLPLGLIVIVLTNLTLYGIILRRIRSQDMIGQCPSGRKSTKTIMMLIVLTLFVVFWLPFIICSCLMQFDLGPSVFQTVVCAREYLVQLGFVNSILNPVIYGLANKKFCTAFNNILCCK